MQSETIGKLAEALAKVQGSMSAAAMDGNNPHFRSRYATLTSVWDACRKPLTDNGLSAVQSFRVDDNGLLLLVTKLIHTSGEWMVSEYPITPVKNDPQGLGSAVTYARRYTLSSIVGVVADDDDDGNAASGQQSPSRHVNGNGNPAQVRVATGNDAQDDNPFNDSDKPSEAQHKMLFAVGVKVYGKDNWDAKRKELVLAVTHGRTDSSTELGKAEMRKLLDGLKEKEKSMPTQQAAA